MDDAPGRIKLCRRFNLAAMARKLDVVVDGTKIGNIGNGQDQSFEVAPGRRAVEVKLWSRSELLNLDLLPNKSIELECGVSNQFWIRAILLAQVGFLGYCAKHVLPGYTLPILGVAVFALIVVCTSLNFKRGGTYYLKRVDGSSGDR
jgi:hypothetical protein